LEVMKGIHKHCATMILNLLDKLRSLIPNGVANTSKEETVCS